MASWKALYLQHSRQENQRESAVYQHWGVPSTFTFPSGFINF